MHHRVHPGERALHRGGVAHVADLELHLRIEVAGASPAGPVDLREQRIEHPHAISFGEQQVGEMGADEAGSAGDEDLTGHARIGG